MLRNWRTWVLLILLVGPVLAYVGLGALWLAQHRGPLGLKGELLYYAMTVWVVTGIAFAVLANRWTKAQRPMLPPIDWDVPRTFTAQDREAWDLVQKEAERGDQIAPEMLTSFDTYLDTGRGLARRLAAHYRPDAADPLERVPVVDLLTALQLAAEDLASITRQVPGGDLITPAHWKRAVAAVNLVQRANEFYTLLLPIFQPVAGLARLGAQKLMVQPSWRNAQANLMRWFYRAFVNRLGTHLIELYSGRLAIGAETYRRLTRKSGHAAEVLRALEPMRLAVAGIDGVGKSALITALDRARREHLERVRAELAASGHDVALADRLRAAEEVEVTIPKGESDLKDAVEQAADADLLVLAVDVASEGTKAEARFVADWLAWYAARPGRDTPPAVLVLTHADRPELGDPLHPPFDWVQGRRPREKAVRAIAERLRPELLPLGSDLAIVGLPPGSGTPFGIIEGLLPALARQLPRSERGAILRHLDRLASRSTARRILGQVGQQGKRLWGSLSAARKRHRNAAGTS
jgi:hypothetical protein